jgi:hypothetical protein
MLSPTATADPTYQSLLLSEPSTSGAQRNFRICGS